MSFFRRPDYRSDATNFINELKKQKPELPSQQLAGRSLLWDKDVNHEVWEDLRAESSRREGSAFPPLAGRPSEASCSCWLLPCGSCPTRTTAATGSAVLRPVRRLHR